MKIKESLPSGKRYGHTIYVCSSNDLPSSSDAMCGGDICQFFDVSDSHLPLSGPEHAATTSTPAQPSYCTLPLFHASQPSGGSPAGGMGYISNDGHSFSCKNPAVMQQAFHVFVRSCLNCI